MADKMIFFGGVMALNRPKPGVLEITKVAPRVRAQWNGANADVPTAPPRTALIAELAPINATPPENDSATQPSPSPAERVVGEASQSRERPTSRRLYDRPITHLSDQQIVEAVRDAESEVRKTTVARISPQQDDVATELPKANPGLRLARTTRGGSTPGWFRLVPSGLGSA